LRILLHSSHCPRPALSPSHPLSIQMTKVIFLTNSSQFI
jgi:hypothetical protein